jgi:hypothetical protein
VTLTIALLVVISAYCFTSLCFFVFAVCAIHSSCVFLLTYSLIIYRSQGTAKEAVTLRESNHVT